VAQVSEEAAAEREQELVHELGVRLAAYQRPGRPPVSIEELRLEGRYPDTTLLIRYRAAAGEPEESQRFPLWADWFTPGGLISMGPMGAAGTIIYRIFELEPRAELERPAAESSDTGVTRRRQLRLDTGETWKRRYCFEVEIGELAESSEPDDERRWVMRFHAFDPDSAALDEFGGGPSPHSSLRALLLALRGDAWLSFATALGTDVVPLDDRLAQLLGTATEPTRPELAAKLAVALGFRRPSLPESGSLLVNLALGAQRYYDDPDKRYNSSAHIGSAVVSGAWQSVRGADYGRCAADLGCTVDEFEERLWSAACDLVARMGIPVA